MHCPVPLRLFRAASGIACGSLALCALPACGDTVDWLGYDRMDSDELRPLTGPQDYPNALSDVLGKSDEEIASKIEATFQQLFYGDKFNEAIFYTDAYDADRAYIWDTLHGQVRTEGMGFGMMITVQLDKQDEFDRLWRYAKEWHEHTSGPKQGYFVSFCDVPWSEKPVFCSDPFGLQQLAMALLFAHGRWGSDTGTIDYGAEAIALLEVMQHKETLNGGVDDGVTNIFDPETKLVFDVPNVEAADTTRPSVEMPAYYELWAQATGDPFWSEAAESAREHWRRTAHPITGLIPVRAHFDGTPVTGSANFDSESYRTLLNLALDQIWFGADPWQVEEANRLLAFFSRQGIDWYGGAYTLDGVLIEARDPALVVTNGVVGLVATAADRAEYIEAAWAAEPATGLPRYYPGLLHLLSLITLSGQFRVY
ncbi:glycosyl hydrolase family 8 [Sorangium sp. So ce861]|uniref:glycosyl hydrolase family 8 n=1 Tax=Sorangium sp. So ce861 TaxID=3133323 RepID=UPI003F5EED7F